MPKLPDLSLQERPSVRPNLGITPANESYSGLGVGAQAIQGLGHSMLQASEIARQEEDRLNTLRAEDAYNQYRQRQLDYTLGPQGFMNIRGADAVNRPLGQEYGSKLSDEARNLAEMLGNDRQKEMFGKRVAVANLQFNEQLMRHQVNESENYSKSVLTNTIDTEIQSATANYNSPNDIAASSERMRAAINTYGQGRLSQEEISNLTYKAESQLTAGVIEAWRQNDPIGALQQFQDLKEQIQEPQRMRLGSQIFQAAAAPLAAKLVLEHPGQFENMKPKEAFNAKTGDSLIDSLPQDWRMHIIALARSQEHQKKSELKAEVAGEYADAVTEAMVTGRMTSPPSRERLIDAYGPEIGARKHDSMLDTQKTGMKLQEMQHLPTAVIMDMVDQKPSPGEGFQYRQQHYEVVSRAAEAIVQSRQIDPIATAISTNAYGIKPIQDWSDPNNVQVELRNRAGIVDQMSQDYGVTPQLISRGESVALSSILKTQPPEVQKQYLAATYRGIGDIQKYRSLMQSIAPNAPTIALAGMRQAQGALARWDSEGRQIDVADLMLRGHALLNPVGEGKGHEGGRSLIKMPQEKLIDQKFQQIVGNAFDGHQRDRDLYYQAAKEIYAARTSDDGDNSGDINNKRLESAIQLATGGIQNHRGSNIAMPYGMSYDVFRDQLAKRLKVMEPNVINATAEEMVDLPLMDAGGEGRYYIQRGSGVIVGKDNKPAIVDFGTPLQEPARQIVPPAPPNPAVREQPDFAVTSGGAVTGRAKRKP
jgi:hypothetical protein